MTDKLQVTQADIAAAYEQARRAYATPYDYEMDLRNTFARHAHEAEQRERQRIVEWCNANIKRDDELERAYRVKGDESMARHVHLRACLYGELADAIAAGQHQEERDPEDYNVGDDSEPETPA